MVVFLKIQATNQWDHLMFHLPHLPTVLCREAVRDVTKLTQSLPPRSKPHRHKTSPTAFLSTELPTVYNIHFGRSIPFWLNFCYVPTRFYPAELEGCTSYSSSHLRLWRLAGAFLWVCPQTYSQRVLLEKKKRWKWKMATQKGKWVGTTLWPCLWCS